MSKLRATLAAVLACSLAAAGEGYVWPLSLEPQLTSSFAEYRPGRFHAGIDLRTNGVGRDVFAAGDGYISRVRCSPYGYGKAVYLQLADGNVAVYGHLSDYFPELAEFVRTQQHKARNYTLDVQLKPSQFPVQRGELIAKSGQTGIGAPHLHYELRNAAEEPINPRLLGVNWPDTIPPTIGKILVSPKGLEGRVNGDVLPVALDVTRDEQGNYATAPVHAAGLIGFGADVIDPGAGGYNLGVHQLRVLAAGTEIFRMQHDLMSYTNHRNAAVSYHPYMRQDGRFLVLWRWPGNRCASYQQSPGEGWTEVPAARTEYTVEATDFLGNRVQVRVPVYPDGDSPDAMAAGQGVTLDPLGAELLVSARLGEPSTVSPRLMIDSAEGPPFSAINATLYRAAFSPRRSGRYILEVQHPDLAASPLEIGAWVQGAPATTLTLGDLQITAGPNAPYGVLMFRAWTVDAPPAHPMSARSAAYELWPGNTPIFDDVTISLPLSTGAEVGPNVHVYRHTGSSWSRENTTLKKGRLEFKTDTGGVFLAMADTDAPNLSDVSPSEGYAAQTRRPEIRARVSDAGSGIDRFEIHCGETWLLTAYDPEHDEIRWERDEDLPSGSQTITFTLTDEAGNSRRFERTITIP